jgi:hypothetical protein
MFATARNVNRPFEIPKGNTTGQTKSRGDPSVVCLSAVRICAIATTDAEYYF